MPRCRPKWTLLFEKPRSAKDGVKYSMPLLINALGSKRRLELALDETAVFARDEARIPLGPDVIHTGDLPGGP